MPTYTTALPRAGKPRFRALRLAFLLLLLALVSLAEPRVFQFVVRHFIVFEAWRTGGRAHIRSVEGSLFEPIRLYDASWTFRSATGAVTRLSVDRTVAEVAWENLFGRDANRCFQRLTFDGVVGKIELPMQLQSLEEPDGKPLVDLSRFRVRWWPVPVVVEAREVDLVFQSNRDFVRLEKTHFRVSELEPGIIKVGRVTIQQPWLRKSFFNVRGTTALRGSDLLVANLTLEPGVVIRTFSAELAKLAQGQLKQRLDLAVFGGTIDAQAETKLHHQRLDFEASGNFSQIDIAKLATFLAISEAAGGTIKEGNFSFRGSPQNVAKSTTRLRLDATNFQWESRQWDSLVFGVELMERRLHVHEIELHQGRNELVVNGEITLPLAQQKWWQSDFQWNVSAKIDNLTDLSALLLPEFKFAAGTLHAEGSIRGDGEKFHGQLVVDGSRLQWRSAPVDELHATLRFNGNELQVSNFNLFNDGDYVRGQGVVNILGPAQYWGTLRGSVDELGRYAALLQKPIMPEPLAGGAVLDWSGEGSAKGHSGKFMARLRKLRSLGASAARLHPINADLEGSYAAGGMVFSKFALSDDESSFTANVAVGNKALALQGIRLMHGQELWLEGDALLPLDVWKAWPNTSLATLLNDEVQSKVALTAYNLNLGAASKLTGWNFPIEGVVRGNLTAEGPLRALQTGGRLTLSRARLPLGASGLALTEIEGEATFSGQNMTLVQLAGKHPTGDLRVSGEIDLKDVRDAGLTLAVQSAQSAIPLFRESGATSTPVTLRTSLDLRITGPVSAAQVSGQARALSLDPARTLTIHEHDLPELSWLWRDGPRVTLPALFSVLSQPARGWRLQVTCAAPEPVPMEGQAATAHGALRLTGTGAAPVLDGVVSFQGVEARTGEHPLVVHAAVLAFRENSPANPSLELAASGQLHTEPFFAWLAGPLSHLIRGYDFPPSLTLPAVQAALAGSAPETPGSSFSWRFPHPLSDGVRNYEWSIPEPPPPPPPAPLENNAASKEGRPSPAP